MRVTLFADEHPALAQERDNVGIRIEHVLARQLRHTSFVGEQPAIVDGR